MSKTVYQYDTKGDYVTYHEKIVDAAKSVGTDEANIRYAIKKNTIVKNYYWALEQKVNLFTNHGLDFKEYQKAIEEQPMIPYNKDLKEVCNENNIPIDSVNHYWYKGKNYSIHTKQNNASPEKQFKILANELRKDSKIVKLKERNKIHNNCAIINIYDAHLDKRDIDYPNCGRSQVDAMTDEIEEGFIKVLESVQVNLPDTYILPVGNDLFTTNGFMSTTKKGTPQNPIVTHEYVFREGLSLIRKFIDTLAEYGEVVVPVIQGNHDTDSAWYLGTCLEVIYENNENVTINNELRSRKYYQYWDNLFGFTHGDKAKRKISDLPLTMATENPKIWGETKNRVYFCGDLHHKQEFQFLRTKDFKGCEVKFLRSISITDDWHDENMFTNIPRTIEAYIFNKEKGQIANYSVNI